MNVIQAILTVFAALRKKGINDPVFARLLLTDDRGRVTRGWIWRNPARVGKNIQSGETFTLTLDGSEAVEFTWLPLFYARIEGKPADQKRALWFLHNRPRVTGGSWESIEEFTSIGKKRTWQETTDDFVLVRLGKGRRPSTDALEYVRDVSRFQVSEDTRNRVLDAMSKPMGDGRWVTIRRVFADEAA